MCEEWCGDWLLDGRDNDHLKRELELLRARHSRQQRVLNKVPSPPSLYLTVELSVSLDSADNSVPDSYGVQRKAPVKWQEKTVSLFTFPLSLSLHLTPPPPPPPLISQ